MRKEWMIEEIVAQSESYSSSNIYEFEEGKNICFFVKDSNMLYYCGPMNLRRKKLTTYTLWTYYYCVYVGKEFWVLKDLSYIWDVISSLHIPEELICNPMIVLENEKNFQIAKARETYSCSDIDNIYILDVLPNSDTTYMLTLYINNIIMKKINNVQKYEPSLNSPNHIFVFKNIRISGY